MPAQTKNYQCPACTGPLHFDAATGRLACEYCGSSFDVAELERREAEKNGSAAHAGAGAWDTSGMAGDWQADGLRAYLCPSCGAELLCDETTAATSCPYCGNPMVLTDRLEGVLRPDYILPFRVDKAAAVQALKAYYKGKPLLPKAFTAENHMEEIKGVYVPFWLFDGTAEADARFHATRTFLRSDGKYEITTTQHFEVHRAGTIPFQRVPVDASSKMPDDYMDSIEPFDYAALEPFAMGYLPGYLADKYDRSVADCAGRVEERIRNSAIEALQETVHGYDLCVPEYAQVEMHRGQVRYALFPVWLLSTRWKGQSFLFAMNGQTGKLVGDLPISWRRLCAWFAGIALPLAAVLAAALFGFG
ncbi:MAG TPA: hypothetical protein IAA32_10535 [Candidatus Butyricicoccus stercorigallinarum]|nr:hypothetical protein [Candidatus Butyricicoccus stercorigallinarum]